MAISNKRDIVEYIHMVDWSKSKSHLALSTHIEEATLFGQAQARQIVKDIVVLYRADFVVVMFVNFLLLVLNERTPRRQQQASPEGEHQITCH